MDLHEAKVMAQGEVLKWLGPQWKVSYFRAAKLFGQCRQSDTVQVIRLNELFLAKCDKKQVLELVRHEIAHALAGRGHGHDGHFAKCCATLGISAGSKMRVDLSVPFKFQLTCKRCGKVYHKHTYKKAWVCGTCKGGLLIERLTYASVG